MNRILKGLSVVAVVLVLALLIVPVQPAAADDVSQLTNKVAVSGGTTDGIISVWQAGGGPAADSAGQPIGNMESATRVSPTGLTEVFVPLGKASNVFIWTPSKGYSFLGTVAPSQSAGGPITLEAK
jgi:hypothetical protein